jgi:RNA polymerase sigma-70 factor, ECF subfamily
VISKEVVNKAKYGDEHAFQSLIQSEKNKLYRIAFMYVRNEDSAIDIVQEAVYKAFISIKTIKNPEYFSTWLTKIVINSALDYLKREKRFSQLKEVERIEAPEKHSIEDKLDLLEALEQLDVQYKTVIILRYYKDLPVKKIAEIINCPEGTIKTWLHRAINQLKRLLKEE